MAEAPEKAEAGEASSHRNPRPLSRSTQTPTHTIKVRPIQSLLLPGLRLSFGLPPHSLLGHGVYGSSLGRRGRTPSRNPAESDLVWGPGAARAGTAQGSTFPRDITGAVQSSAVQFLNPKQSPCAEAMVQQPLTPPRGGGNNQRTGERTSGASNPCSACVHSWLPPFPLIFNTPLQKKKALLLCFTDLHQPATSPFHNSLFQKHFFPLSAYSEKPHLDRV